MRATQHSGRVSKSGRGYSTRHNDRSFMAEGIEADNIDTARTPLNETWNLYGADTFEEAERTFYEQTFGDTLRATNERYIKQRHFEKIKGMDDWRASKRHCPEEVIVQVGKLEEHISDETFKEICHDYLRELGKLNGEHMHVLDYAIHLDEAVPHMHVRRVWIADGRDGKTTGQEKALEALGVPLADPSASPSRTNNRKKTFDAHMRKVFLDICEAHGLDIEREPVPDARHNRTKGKLIRDENARLLDENKRFREENGRLSEENERLHKGIGELGKRLTERPITEKKSILGKPMGVVEVPINEWQYLTAYVSLDKDAVIEHEKAREASQKAREDEKKAQAMKKTIEAEKKQIKANLEATEAEKEDSALYHRLYGEELAKNSALERKLAEKDSSLKEIAELVNEQGAELEAIKREAEPSKRKLAFAKKLLNVPFIADIAEKLRTLWAFEDVLNAPEAHRKELGDERYIAAPHTQLLPSSKKLHYFFRDIRGQKTNGDRDGMLTRGYLPRVEELAKAYGREATEALDQDLVLEAYETRDNDMQRTQTQGRSR